MLVIKKVIIVVFGIMITSICFATVDPTLKVDISPPDSPIIVPVNSMQPVTVTVSLTGVLSSATLQFDGTDSPSTTNKDLSIDKATNESDKQSCQNLPQLTSENPSCNLHYIYAPQYNASPETQIITVYNTDVTPAPFDPIITNIDLQPEQESSLVFASAPSNQILPQNPAGSTLLFLNYIVKNTLTNDSIKIQKPTNLPLGFNMIPLENSGVASCFDASSSSFTLQPQTSCNIELSYDGSSGSLNNFSFALNLGDNASQANSPAISITLGAYNFTPIEKEIFMANDAVVSGSNLQNPEPAIFVAWNFTDIQPAGSHFLDNRWPDQLLRSDHRGPAGTCSDSITRLITSGGNHFASESISNASFSYVGNSSAPHGVIVTAITGGLCGGYSKILQNNASAINYDGRFYADQSNIYETANDQSPLALAIPLPAGYSIDGLRVNNTDLDPMKGSYYITAHNQQDGILLIGKPVNGSIQFTQASGLKLPPRVAQNSTIPSMKIYADNNVIIVEQYGAQYIYSSYDGGQSWQASSMFNSTLLAQPNTQTITDLSVSKAGKTGTMLFVAGEASLAYSLDLGRSWVNFAAYQINGNYNTSVHARGIYSEPSNDGGYYVGISYPYDFRKEPFQKPSTYLQFGQGMLYKFSLITPKPA